MGLVVCISTAVSVSVTIRGVLIFEVVNDKGESIEEEEARTLSDRDGEARSGERRVVLLGIVNGNEQLYCATIEVAEDTWALILLRITS